MKGKKKGYRYLIGWKFGKLLVNKADGENGCNIISSRARRVYNLYWHHRIRDDDGYFMYAEPVITAYKNKHDLHEALVENMLWELKQYSFLYSGVITKSNVENIIRGIEDDFALKNPIVQKIKVSKTCIELAEYFKFEIK